jgi:hypothetical protein
VEVGQPRSSAAEQIEAHSGVSGPNGFTKTRSRFWGATLDLVTPEARLHERGPGEGRFGSMRTLGPTDMPGPGVHSIVDLADGRVVE